MAAPARPQVDSINSLPGAPDGGPSDMMNDVTKVSTTPEVEKPYAQDNRTNKLAKEGGDVTVEKTTQTTGSGGAGAAGSSDQIERPYAADSEHRQATQSFRGAKQAVSNVSGQVSDQMQSNLRSADQQHHFA